MNDITTLWDLLNNTHGFLHMEISDDLLDLGYVWEYSSADDCYRLLDLSLSNYFYFV